MQNNRFYASRSRRWRGEIAAVCAFAAMLGANAASTFASNYEITGNITEDYDFDGPPLQEQYLTNGFDETASFPNEAAGSTIYDRLARLAMSPRCG